MAYTLILGDAAYSSWSLRGWLLFEAFGVPHERRMVRLWSEAFYAAQADIAPAATVPAALLDEDGERQVLWDSLAMAEHLAERFPDAGHWPRHPTARLAARSITAEMHSGFSALRQALPMNMVRRYPNHPRGPEVDADIQRIETLWAWARKVSMKAGLSADGPYLFGAYSVADAFFTPVASRFHTYAAPLEPEHQTYADALLAHPSTAAWWAEAKEQPWIQERYHFELKS